MILNSKSVFLVVNFDQDHGWESLIELTDDYLDSRGLNRLKAVLVSSCQSVVVERSYIDKDYRDTFANFHSKRFVTPSSRCIRLHFFKIAISEEELAEDKSISESNEYLGYSVIRVTRPNSIGRTFLSHRLRQNENTHVCLCEESAQILGESRNIKGFPFISQDADATVCAESSLWMVLRYLSNRYRAYGEILPFQITELATKHAVGRRVFPSTGLYSWQLAEALRLQGVSPLVYSRKRYDSDFEHLLYTYIESGFPILTTVDGHVFVSYGHGSDFSETGNSQSDNPQYSSVFNRSLVISDDNHFPYQTLRKLAEDIKPNESRYCFENIQEFIVPLPERVFLPAESAQKAIEGVLGDPVTGINALSPSLKDQKLTFRLFLTTGRSFKSKLLERGMGAKGVNGLYRQLPLPHFIWVCEISITSEYLDDFSIRGEVLWDATRNAHEPNGWIALHYPEIMAVDIGGALNQRQSLSTLALSNSSKYPLFQSNLNPLQDHARSL